MPARSQGCAGALICDWPSGPYDRSATSCITEGKARRLTYFWSTGFFYGKYCKHCYYKTMEPISDYQGGW